MISSVSSARDGLTAQGNPVARFMEIVRTGDLNQIKTALKRVRDINITEKPGGKTALHHAVEAFKERVFILWHFSTKLDVNEKLAELKKLKQKYGPVIKFLLDKGADRNAETTLKDRSDIKPVDYIRVPLTNAPGFDIAFNEAKEMLLAA